MHALPSYPKPPIFLVALAMLLALMLLAVSAPDLGTLDLSLGSDGAAATDAAAPTAPGAEPRWIDEPLAPPLAELGAR